MDARDERVRERIRRQDVPDPLRVAREAMFDYSVRERDGLQRSIDLETASLLLSAAQSRLEKRGVGALLEPADAFPIFADRCWSLRALRNDFGVARAKAIELEVTGGAPLTICMGRPAYYTSPLVITVELGPQLAYAFGMSSVTIPLWGCLRVFEESTNRGRGKKWRSWCPACVPNRSHPERAAARRHLQYLRAPRAK